MFIHGILAPAGCRCQRSQSEFVFLSTAAAATATANSNIYLVYLTISNFTMMCFGIFGNHLKTCEPNWNRTQHWISFSYSITHCPKALHTNAHFYMVQTIFFRQRRQQQRQRRHNTSDIFQFSLQLKIPTSESTETVKPYGIFFVFNKISNVTNECVYKNMHVGGGWRCHTLE